MPQPVFYTSLDVWYAYKSGLPTSALPHLRSGTLPLPGIIREIAVWKPARTSVTAQVLHKYIRSSGLLCWPDPCSVRRFSPIGRINTSVTRCKGHWLNPANTGRSAYHTIPYIPHRLPEDIQRLRPSVFVLETPSDGKLCCTGGAEIRFL